jgi:hypothetical protein
MTLYDVSSCLDAARLGELDDWVHRYLSGGPWANLGLRDGLRRQRRYWIGPRMLPLARLERCCGPEPGMEYPIPAEAWERRVGMIAASLREPASVPPLIVEWRSGILSVRDGSHRSAAMIRVGWTECWVIVWCNDLADHQAAQGAIGTYGCSPD